MKSAVEFFRSMLSQGGISSKRVWGSILMAMLVWAYIYCTVNDKEMLDGTDAYLMLAALLLGLETFMQPFKK